jgi:Tfp pilus assembly protein PilN
MPMIEINLLPKQYSRRSGGLSLGKHGVYAVIAIAGVLLMFASVTAWQLYKIDELNGQMEIAKARTLQLQKDIQLVDALTDIKSKLTDRLNAVEKLDRHRSVWVRILEDMAKNVPDFVWLSRFEEKPDVSQSAKQQGDTTAVVTVNPNAPVVRPAEVEGFTFTLNALATLMIKMMRSNYFDNVDLALTEEQGFDDHIVYNFKIKCDVHYLSDEELEQILTMAALESQENKN